MTWAAILLEDLNDVSFFLEIDLTAAILGGSSRLPVEDVPETFGDLVIAVLTATLSDPRFWNKKIKIALLAAATFAAMC